MKISRREALGGSACAAITAVAAAPRGARAAAQPAGRQAPGIYRHRLGDFEITTVNDGQMARPVQEGLVRNASLAEVKSALDAEFLPTDQVRIPFTPLVVNTGRRLVLIDAGTGGKLGPTSGNLIENLEAAGIDAKAIDAVVISHFHPDHILGLRAMDGARHFPNAEVMVPAPEWAFWMDEGAESRAPAAAQGMFKYVRKVFGDMGKEVKRFEPGKEVVPGITSRAAFGHTPGHCMFEVTSNDETLFVLSDTVNVPALFVRNPSWQPTFDMDPAMAAETRRRVLDMVATERALVTAYHFPFPALGHIAKDGPRFEFKPVFWSSIP